MADQSWQDRQFDLADFEKEYGMLAYTFKDVLNASKPSTSAVQNYVAEKVVERFRSRYNRYVASYDPRDAANIERTEKRGFPNAPMSYGEYFARNDDAYLEVTDEPLDLSFGGMLCDNQGGRSPADLFPSLFKTDQSVRSGMNWLTRSEIPGLMTTLAKPVYGEPASPGAEPPLLFRRAGLFPAEEINAGWLRGHQSIHLYDPSKGNFSIWHNNFVRKGIDDFRAAERQWRAGFKPASVIAGDGESGYVIDGESGDWGQPGETAYEGAGGIQDISHWTEMSVMPATASGKPLDVWDAVTNLQRHVRGPNYGRSATPLGDEPNWSAYNVQTGRFGYNPDAPTSRVSGIDPNSPAAQSGMREGAFVYGLQALMNDPQLPTFVDAIEHGQPFKMMVRQPTPDGKRYATEVLVIQPGVMRGRGIAERDDQDQNWIEKLADRSDEVHTGLWTTSREYSEGMYQADGTWKVSPMQAAPNEQYNVPVVLSPRAMRQFGALYERYHEEWTRYDQVYQKAFEQADRTTLDRYKKFNREHGRLPEKGFYQARDELMEKLLPPRSVPHRGQRKYDFWQSGQQLTRAIRAYEKSLDFSVSTDEDPSGRTIEQFDALVNERTDYLNPASVVQGYIDPGRMERARREVSGAGNYLQRQRSAYYRGLLERYEGRNFNRGGYDLKGNLHSRLNRSPSTAAPRAGTQPIPAGSLSPQPQPRRPIPDIGPYLPEMSDLEAAAYSHSSAINARSAFTPGRMDEDDFPWQTEGQRPREGKARVENTYDNSILGGSPDSLVENDENLAGIRDTGQFLEEGYFKPYPIEGAGVDIFKMLREGRRKDLNEINYRADMSGDAASLEAHNLEPKNDPVMAARSRHDAGYPSRDVDDLEGRNEDFALGESERRFREAWKVLPDPQRPDATLSEKVSSAGNTGGFLQHSKVNWPALLQNHAHAEPGRESHQTYHALKTAHTREAALADELRGNLAALQADDRKASVVRSWLGEGIQQARDMYRRRGRPIAETYRGALKMVSDQYNLNLPHQFGMEAELYTEIERLRTSDNPTDQENYQRVKGVFASPAEQLQASREYVGKMNEDRARAGGNTPPPDRYDPRGSHRVSGVGGTANAKWSPNQIEDMRPNRRRGFDPVTGEFDPTAVENTPVSAQLAARGGGGRSKYNPDLTERQGVIYYDRLSESRLAKQVEYFMENEWQAGGRSMFQYIIREQAGSGFVKALHGQTTDVFAFHNIAVGDLVELEDPDLEKGYRKIGFYLDDMNAPTSADAEFEEYVVSDFDPGEPPDEPPDNPSAATAGAGSNGGGGGGNIANIAVPEPDNTGPGRGRRQKPRTNTDPASFPDRPGAVGWLYQFSQHDPKTRQRRMVTAVGRENSAGELEWQVENEAGEMEALRVNRGNGKIWDENNNLIHNVDYRDAERHRKLNAPLSSAGNNTPQPAHTVNDDPANWPAQPEEGWTLEYKPYSKSVYLHALKDSEGNVAWNEIVSGERIRRDDPGYGIIRDGDEKTLHNVSRLKRERADAAASKPPETTPAPAANAQRSTPNPLAANGDEWENVIASNAGYSSEYNNFARSLGGISAKPYIEREAARQMAKLRSGWEVQAERKRAAGVDPGTFDEAAALDKATKRARVSYDVAVMDAWEHFGAMQENPSVEDVASYLTQEFGDDQERAALAADENDIPTSGPLRSAALAVTDHRRAVGRYSESTRLVHRTGGTYTPARQGATLEEVRARRSERSSWLGNTLARLEKTYTPDNVFRGKVGGVGRLDRDPLGSAGGEDFFGYSMAEDDRVTGEAVPAATHAEVNDAMSIARSAFDRGASGPLPETQVEKMATIKSRAQKAFYSIIDQLTADLERAEGLDKTEAKARVQRIQQIGFEALKFIEKEASAAISGVEGGMDYRDVSAVQHSAKVNRPFSREKALELFNRSQAIRDQIGDQDLEQIMSQERDFFVRDEDGGSYNFGGVTAQRDSLSSAGNRRGGAVNMHGMGRFGSIFYGAYLLRREWQMAAGQTLAAANEYGLGISEYAPLMYQPGADVSRSDIGYAHRQEVGQSYMQKAAYSQFGAFLDIPYRLSQTGNLAAARLLQTGGIAFGVGMGGAIGGAMLTASGMAGVGGALSTVAPWLGGALAASALGMEAYNHFNAEDAPDLTFSSMVTDAEKEAARSRAREKRANRTGRSYDPSKLDTAIGLQHSLDNPVFSVGSYYAKREQFLRSGEGIDLTDEELFADMSEEEKLLWTQDKINARADMLRGHVRAATNETLEDSASLSKALSIQKRFFGRPEGGRLLELSQASTKLGLGSDENLQQGIAYASALGYIEGTPEFRNAAYRYALEGDRTKRAGMQYEGEMTSRGAAQLQAGMGSDPRFTGLGARIFRAGGMETQAARGSWSSIVGGMEAYGAVFGQNDYANAATIVRENSPYVAGVIGNAMESYMAAGGSQYSAMQFGTALSGTGMSSQDASVYGRMMQGDLRAYSYQAWQSGNLNNAFFDQAGRSIFQHNGAVAMQVYNAWAPKLGLGGGGTGSSGNMTASAFLGTSNPEIVSAFNEQGFFGIQQLANQKSYAASMAGIGVQLKGIALQENFYWGLGGSWSNPTAGSAWGIEDRRLALQHESQMANFADQWTRMEMSNDYAVRRESNQLQRMNVNNAHQAWQWSAQYNQFQTQQVWTMQDWAFQDTTRGLNFGWQMEDLNEAIRFSSGRERKQALRQRDRAALSYNMEEEQIETQRGRQEQLWAQEEERFTKQRQYTLEMQELDRESFDLNKDQREETYKLDVQAFNRRMKEYEEEKKLSEELQELQRKFQYDQLQLSKEAAGAQAAAAAAQYEYQQALIQGQENQEKFIGTLENMNSYNMAFRLANATNEMFKMMDSVSTYRVDRLIQLIREIQKAAPSSGTPWGGERE